MAVPRLPRLRPPASSCLGPTGHYCGSPGVEDQVVYVAMLPDGFQRTYTPAEFAEKFGWKNDPDKATLPRI